jgi:ech hydrogenase subunit A
MPENILSAENLSVLLIVLPFCSAAMCTLIRSGKIRTVVILSSGGMLVAAALILIGRTPFHFSPKPILGVPLTVGVEMLDFFLLAVILYLGFRHRSWIIKALALLQIFFLAYFEFFLVKDRVSSATIFCDHLSLLMILIINLVGVLICFQAIVYMKNHEDHLQPPVSKQPRFFGVMLLFLGAMNGLALSNDMRLFYFFFELTTLCSFLLIAHDGSEEATGSAVRALWMNSLGGAAFIIGLVLAYPDTGMLELKPVLVSGKMGSGWYLFGIALLCFAAFTKSAQFPFQSWLLGAMVAPTPVSALLHSSTMVKIGVYLVLRLAPAMSGTFLSQCVAVFGGFTFLCAAALAVGQSNGKKVLAYSTISNLGLIFACAGLNTSQAIIAGMLLIVFHAVIKALLFLCVGAIEQRIASRDIEDMRGLYADMPLTALMTVMGVIMMIMPPFGLLLSKWMAMEAAAGNLYVIMMITLGSALTVMYWARWAGTLMSDPFAGRFKPERQPLLTWLTLGALCAGAGLLSMAAPWLYQGMVPALSQGYLPPFTSHKGILENPYGVFAVLPLSLVAVLGFAVAILAVKRASRARVVKPYLSGVQLAESGIFIGPMNQPLKAEAKNYYLSSIFGEKKLTTWINLAAGVLLTLMAGGAL